MDKAKLMDFIKDCRASGTEPKAEADKRFLDALGKLTVNTRPYRLAWSKPIAFFVLHTTQEAVDILTAEGGT